MRQEGVRQKKPKRHAKRKRHGNPRGRYADGGAPRLPDQLEIGLHAGQQQQHQDSKIGNRLEHRSLFTSCGKERLLRLWPNGSEYRWTQQDAGKQLAHNRRLTNPLHGFAKQAADQKQHDDLRDEKRLRRTHSGSFARIMLQFISPASLELWIAQQTAWQTPDELLLQ